MDAVSFALLAVICWKGAPRTPAAAVAPESGTGAWRTILTRPRLLGLLAVTCLFFFLYGPVEVALPVHVADDLAGSPGLLGTFWAVFGFGAVLGGLGAGLLPHRWLWAAVVVIVIGWGAALLPLGLTDAVGPGLIGFAIGGVIYGPFTAIETGLFQRTSPAPILSRVLALRNAVTIPSVALGTLLGGPLVGAIGARQTMLVSAVLTVALGVLLALVVTVRWAAGRR